MSDRRDDARAFLDREGRLLERRLHAALFEQGSPAGVVDAPWLDAASAWCWEALDAGLPDEAHALREVCVFLEHVPDRARAEALVPAVADRLPGAAWFRADPDSPEYGVTPLHVAPTPDSPWRRRLADDVIAGHLARLRRDQQPDGGWALTWEPPSAAATLEYRGMETLRALRALGAYGA